MKNTKRILSLILALAFIFSLSSCGVFKPPVNTDTDSNTSTDTDIGDETPNDGEVEFSDEAFTVSLRYRGQHYIPTEEITVMWTGEKKIASKLAV